MRILLLLGTLTNSIGTLAIWVMMTPFFARLTENFGTVGYLASTRQFAFLAGSLMAAAWADVGRPLVHLIRVQTFELLLGVILLGLVLFFGTSLSPWVFILWCAVRFLNSGFSFVFGFRVLASASQSVGAGSILHLALTQGANVFGPLLTLLLLKYSSIPFRDAVIVDVLSSTIYLGTLISLRGSTFDQTLTGVTGSFASGLKDGLTKFWMNQIWPWNAFQLVFLIATCGFVLSNQILSSRQSLLSVESFFSTAMLTYGIVLWIAALLITKIKGAFAERVGLFVGSALIGVSGSSLFLADQNTAAAISIVSWCFGFWCLLHLSNRMILNRTEAANAGRLRSSMLFYLSVTFGFGEVLVGQIGSSPNAPVWIGVQRIAGAIVLILILVFSKRARAVSK